MAHEFPLNVWVAWFRDHIHTDCHGRLAVFDRRTDAQSWIAEHGWDCSLRLYKIAKVGNKKVRAARAGTHG